ncbi:amino acid ABC transporter permease [Rhizobium sp. VS19-DR104.2]|uniref:amino acid ABC transporter permease n=1 Tax=unclassified Rhizobium TaxID=2613769 RepID=UPI001CC6B913|nr:MULTISPECIES: amino acid ABC transporter permease [unclassified Rhizobium]MBZ5761457.1 amino acid ABC transporter permease [Rhizobium sp. VS19-DR96]MBZ5767405.1 amino acid ABC transporter permease [Rhizobium sp. VS19-DR129.2]MBZ5775146.1 amino acid ABC transporter permease [Rhizobium sp. VS19-DRK62.2]MBZ5785889.1 amino acid ABC transporter permease [Rhizobium sp. VS19-DR121]MBZ5803315.1 amino acid ABC transporter permease [Rhizobium sp. VS19-DR181]
MAVAAAEGNGSRRSWHSLLYNPELRQFIYQALTVIFIVWLVWYASSNAAQNLEKANMRASLTFLNGRAGFDIAQTPIQYSSDSTYLRALTLGLINTLIVAACGIVTATIIGLLVGMGRLSHNWLIAKLSTVYVEIFRNIPPLLVIFFWYKGVLSLLPDVKKAMSLPLSVYVSNRGVYMPAPIFGAGIWTVPVVCAVGIIGAIVYTRWANKRQLATGKRPPVLLVNLALIIGLPLLAFAIAGFPVTFDIPVLGKFNMNGGTVVGPEFLSLYMALSFYTAAFIAEIVRSGIRGVSKGQSEAAHALGIRPGLTTRLVVLPQALRIIIPPLTSQYLNLTKNSSLAVAIGYADLVAVGGTILNQSGHSIEIIGIWMAIYVSLSLITSLFMNWFNARMALVER